MSKIFDKALSQVSEESKAKVKRQLDAVDEIIKSYKQELIKELEKKEVRKACMKWAKEKGYTDTPLEWSTCKFSFDAGFNLAIQLIKETI